MKSHAANRRSAAKVDVPALYPIACPEMAMIMDQHNKTGFRESPCKSFQAVLLHTGIAVRHRNRRGGTFGAGNEQPTAQRHAALDPELDIPSFRYRHLLFLRYAHQSWTRSTCELYREKYPSERTTSTRYRSASAGFA